MKIQPSDPRVTFQDFPVEIIHLIFVYSLPDDPLDHKQPDIRIAPMLLCRVCSQWRSIALQSPGLWAYLHHHVRAIGDKEQEMWLRTGSYHIPVALEFLEWWRCNLNANHPFHFRLYAYASEPIFRPEDESHVQEPILVTLFNLAQHLDINSKITWLIHDESPALSFPNLETLRIRYNISSLCDSRLLSLRPEHPILKLHMQDFVVDDVFKGPIVLWSSLTHLIFEDVYLSGCEWFDLIRACVNLQFGYFDLHILTHNSEDPRLANPPHFTHRHLRELVVRCRGDYHYPYNLGQYLLKNLFLPSLTTFHLSARLKTQDLRCIFKSLPSFTTSYWVAGNSIWFRPCDDENFLQIHSRRVTPRSRDPNRDPGHQNYPTNFICVYRRADDRLHQQSSFVELFATGRADK
jgi:hypothetical protein